MSRNQLAMLRLATFRRVNGVHAMPRRQLTTHHARSAGGTVRCRRVTIGKEHALGTEPVDIRSVIAIRLIANIHHTKVVRIDVNDVRLRLTEGRRGQN